MEAMLAALPGPLWLKLPLLLLPMLPNLWGIWHISRRGFTGPEGSPGSNIVWLAVCVFVPVMGGLAYIFFGRPGRA